MKKVEELGWGGPTQRGALGLSDLSCDSADTCMKAPRSQVAGEVYQGRSCDFVGLDGRGSLDWGLLPTCEQLAQYFLYHLGLLVSHL